MDDRSNRSAVTTDASASTTEVLVVGGGPAGAAAAYWLARHGHDVTVVEKKPLPTREDVRRRADAAGREAARPTWASSTSWRSYHRYHGPAGHRAWVASSSWSGRRTRSTRSYGYVVRRRDLDQFVAANADAGRGDDPRGPRGRPPARRAGVRPRAPRSPTADGAADRRAGRVHDRRRRRQQPVRPGARARSAPASGRTARRSARTGESPRHADPWIESALDVAGPQRQPDARLRLDLPGRRRHREHRRRAAVDVPRLQERQHHAPARRLRPPDRRPLGDRRRPPGGPARQRTDPDGRVGRPEGRAHVPRHRRRRRQRQPVQRRGHRLRLRDGADGRRRRSTRRSSTTTPRRCSATRSCSRTSTASTSRWPACSPGSSAARR